MTAVRLEAPYAAAVVNKLLMLSGMPRYADSMVDQGRMKIVATASPTC